ncbi:hydantoinase B/oxoprolinase family protein [Chloroflexota bacterium]
MTVSPATIEIMQNRLKQIAHEAGIAMQRAAATPVVVEAKDLGFNIADHLARTIVYSVWMPRHGTTLAYMLHACIDKFKDKGINPGDMFMTNNPHDGALHIFDIAVISPIHYHDELIGWSGCATHHYDVGGMRAGNEVKDRYEEGVTYRPIKIVEGGQLREDIFELFLDNVRMPHYQGLDLKSQIAANNVAREKLIELADRYGVDVLKACYEEIIDFSEKKTRSRIQAIPNGRYEAIEYMDYDKVYTLKCALIVEDDTLTFDLTGTDPQSETFVNSNLACSVANIHNIVVCMLVPDVEANEGCFRPIKVIIPEKTVLNCQPPAPSGGSSVRGGWKAQILAIKALSKALAKSPEWRRVNASWGSGRSAPDITGFDRRGKAFFYGPMDGVMQGGGARATKDGFDLACVAGSSSTSLPNIEAVEQRSPVLYLKRGFCHGSGGTGKYRGGLAGEYMIKLYGTKKAECSAAYVGKDFPADGFAGGQPGATSLISMKTASNVNELLKRRVPDFSDIEGDYTELPQHTPSRMIDEDDVLYIRGQGGGGYGDPLDRDPSMVCRDVSEGYISVESAEAGYGVVISHQSLQVDVAATERLRKNIRDGKSNGDVAGL